jgi:tubulin polyglutamylase TTLL6/13
MNVAFTRYKIVRYVAKKFGYRLNKNENSDSDICWIDAGISYEKLMKMKQYQRINHFPGMYAIARKNLLARNLMKMQSKFPLEYDFFPKTWTLPAEMLDFKSQFPVGKSKRPINKPTFICKPDAACQGRGIFLINSFNKIPTKDNYIAQDYITKPYLIDGLKFDLRLYVLICGVDPLRIYLYDDGLARFATHQYKKPANKNLKNSFIHLTNYSINKNSTKYESNKGEETDDKGHKRSYKSILEHFKLNGENVEKLQEEIEASIIKTM